MAHASVAGGRRARYTAGTPSSTCKNCGNPGGPRAAPLYSQILSGWHLDHEFVGENGRPKDLSPTGPTGSLPALLKRYAGDLPHGAIRKEMLQRGLIEELEDGGRRVLKWDYVYSSLDPDIVRQMGVALHDHAATLEHNLDDNRKADARFEGIADNGAISTKAVKAIPPAHHGARHGVPADGRCVAQ